MSCSTFGVGGDDDEPAPAPANDAGTLAADAADESIPPFEDGGESVDIGDDPDAAVVGSPSLVPDGGKIVFVTHADYPGSLGGVAGADANCASAASNAGLTGKFIAYVHTDNGVGTSRFAAPGTWYRLDGKIVFDNVLPKATNAKNAIELAEDGKIASQFAKAWTGESSAASTLGSCDVWKIMNGSGVIGDVHSDTSWAVIKTRTCSDVARLYCFQQ